MKFKILTLIAISAVVTLSFTFASVKNNHKKATIQTSDSSNDTQPVGGFAFDEK